MKRKLTKTEWLIFIVPLCVLVFLGAPMWRDSVSPTMKTRLQSFTVLRYSPDGRFLAGIGYAPQIPNQNGTGVTEFQQSELVMWNTESQKQQFRHKLNYQPVGLPVFSSDGQLRLNTGSAYIPPRAWQAWDVVTSREQMSLIVPAAPPKKIPQWQSVYPVNIDGSMNVMMAGEIRSASTLEVRTYEGHKNGDVADGATGAVLFSIPLTQFPQGRNRDEYFQRGNLLFRFHQSKGNISRLETWDITQRKLKKSHDIGDLSVRTLSHDGLLALATPFRKVEKEAKQSWWTLNHLNNDVVLVDTSTGARLQTWSAIKALSTLTFSPDAKRILVGGDLSVVEDNKHDSFFQLLDIHGKTLWSNTIKNFWWVSATFSPDSRLIATVSASEKDSPFKSSDSIILWSAKTGKRLMSCGSTNQSTPTFTFSPDSKTLAFSQNNVVEFVDVSTLN